ncbi:hypothetical protein GCM10010353_16720 [Streptomyces chryseus]|uniref:hypothetical protein n=1 Tax=Streptomyces chryseus TaxID=68186 RepID=UPI00110FE42D|nr:hypothetical protein [Streptomyces chryseus]GGX01774.1 hypothetical protein GCM10010353_16720 [Streptomyces chryseus]
MSCPHCQTPMHRAAAPPERWYCRTCTRYAAPGDTAADIEAHEAQRQHALALLDEALGERAVQREADRQIVTQMEADMGQTIQTRGCSKCGGTMYRTVETDDNGNPTGYTMFICGGCGHMES